VTVILYMTYSIEDKDTYVYFTTM